MKDSESEIIKEPDICEEPPEIWQKPPGPCKYCVWSLEYDSKI